MNAVLQGAKLGWAIEVPGLHVPDSSGSSRTRKVWFTNESRDRYKGSLVHVSIPYTSSNQTMCAYHVLIS